MELQGQSIGRAHAAGGRTERRIWDRAPTPSVPLAGDTWQAWDNAPVLACTVAFTPADGEVKRHCHDDCRRK